jgi:DNA repair protein RecO (recombination protein O)
MPLDQADAIVLRTSALGDIDKLAVFLTREKGLVRGVAKGARKFGNRFGSALEPMSHVTVFYYEKERRDLVTVSGCDLVESFFEIQADLKSSLTLSYFAELIEEVVPGRSSEDVMFRLLLSVLRALRMKGELGLLTRYFEAWFLQANGFLPDVGRCRGCRRELAGEEAGWLSPKRDGIYCDACAPDRRDEVGRELARFVQWARRNPPPSTDEIPFSPGELKAVQKSLQALIVFHLEREPRSLRYIRE